MALLQPITTTPEPVAAPVPAAHIRRCTFRRLTRVPAPGATTYEVACLYPNRRLPLPIGDLQSSLPVCDACVASHIFRPDED